MGEDFQTLALAARAALEQGALERAEALFGRLAEAHPGHPLGLAGGAQAALRRRDFAAALKLWEECWARHPADRRADWLRGRAEALAGLGRVGEAEALIAPLLETDDPAPHATFASLAMTAGRWGEARARWELLLERFAERAEPRWRRARAEALFRLGEHAAAEAAYGEIARADAGDEFAAVRYLRLLGRAAPEAALAEIAQGRFKGHPGYEIALAGAQLALRCDEMDHVRRALARLIAEASRAYHVAAAFDLVPAALEGRARVEAWTALERRTQALADAGRGAERSLCQTLLARLKLALRDSQGFLALLDDPGFAPEPAWGAAFASLRRRLRAPAFPDHDAPKVFGVGLSKTGTTSLSRALERLGYLVAQYRNPFTGEIVTAEDAFLFDALSDLPICPDFEALFHLFPNSKFVYTTRPMEAWVKSGERHLKEHQGSADFAVLRARMTTPGRVRYGAARARSAVAVYFRHADLRAARLAYEARIADFFTGARADRLLRFDMSAGDGWEKLCGFLGRPVPETAFPWENRAPA